MDALDAIMIIGLSFVIMVVALTYANKMADKLGGTQSCDCLSSHEPTEGEDS